MFDSFVCMFLYVFIAAVNANNIDIKNYKKQMSRNVLHLSSNISYQ